MNDPHSFDDLVAMLRNHADGVYAYEAAAELVIRHKTWLRRADFADNFVTVDLDFDEVPLASIDWPSAIDALDNGLLPCSGSEANVLRIASSIATGAPISLGVAVSGLDTTNLTAVLVAIAHAGGYRNTEVTLS